MEVTETQNIPALGGGGQPEKINAPLTNTKNIGKITNIGGKNMKKGITLLEGVKDAFNLRKKKCAFTLAEVLITLGIIGIVAALTMPSLIAKHQEKERVTRLKKVYSVLDNAYRMAVNEHGTPDNWGLKGYTDPESAVTVTDYFTKYLNISKYCKLDKGCWSDTVYKYLNNSDYASIDNDGVQSKFVLNDGTQIAVYSYMGYHQDIYVYAHFHVDINGAKGPNKFGEDTFLFEMQKERILPLGFPESSYKFEEDCNGPASLGTSCAGWVVMNENMDYLHCDDLSWDGKTKCK